MSRWKVVLYLPIGAVWASVNDVYGGEVLYFDTLLEAETYGRSKYPVVFETVEVKDDK